MVVSMGQGSNLHLFQVGLQEVLFSAAVGIGAYLQYKNAPEFLPTNSILLVVASAQIAMFAFLYV